MHTISRMKHLCMVLGLIFAGPAGCDNTPPEIKNTRYVPGYTREKFDKVQVGMTLPQVVEILGQPLATMDAKSGYKRYTFSHPKDETKEFSCVDVGIGPDGKVSDKFIMKLSLE